MAGLRVELLSGLAAIDEDKWERVLATSPTRTIFQTLAWQLTWWETFGRGDLLLIGVYEHGQLTALAPLFADHGMVFFVGSGGSDYLDFIGNVALQRQVLPRILELAMRQTSDFVGFRFYHVPDDSPTGHSLGLIASDLDLDCIDEGSVDAPALRFADWPVDKRAPADKRSLVRCERAMERVGRLEVDHFSDAVQVAPLLSAFFDQHIARWSESPFPSLFLDEIQRDFYHRLTESLSSCGWLRFSRVSLDSQPVAFHFGFLYRGRFLWYKPSFDISRAKQSPGEVLIRYLLVRAEEEEAQVFDFGIGDEPFKSRFSTEIGKVRTLGMYPSTHSSSSTGRRTLG